MADTLSLYLAQLDPTLGDIAGNLAEYKRRQAPPGIKITRRSFGRDRRYPIVNAFSGASALAPKSPGKS